LREIIKQILTTNLDGLSAYDELLYLFNSFKKFPFFIIPINPNQEIYRSRYNVINESKKEYSEFKDFLLKDSDKVIDFGRLNKPFQSVLYVSESIKTTISELMPNWFTEVGARELINVTTGEFKINEILKVIVIPDFKNRKMNKLINKAKIKEETDDDKYFLSFINMIFRDNSLYNSKTYIVTAAFANTLRTYCYNKSIRFDGILYTSAQDRKGYNVALEPHVIDNHMIRLKKITKEIIRKIDSSPKYITQCKTIKPKSLDFLNNKIIW